MPVGNWIKSRKHHSTSYAKGGRSLINIILVFFFIFVRGGVAESGITWFEVVGLKFCRLLFIHPNAFK